MRSGKAAAALDPHFVAMLACPQCGAPVRQAENRLICQQSTCGLRYPIEDGIPVMLVAEADHLKDAVRPKEAP